MSCRGGKLGKSTLSSATGEKENSFFTSCNEGTSKEDSKEGNSKVGREVVIPSKFFPTSSPINPRLKE
jgi:hypothetical protein